MSTLNKLVTMILVLLVIATLATGVFLAQKKYVAASSEGECIVQIEGGYYDVTQLRTFHEGGDLFDCGKDVTRIYYYTHNKAFLETVMQVYRVE